MLFKNILPTKILKDLNLNEIGFELETEIMAKILLEILTQLKR